MTSRPTHRLAEDHGTSRIGAKHYFMVGGAGIAIAAFAVASGSFPSPQISSDAFQQPSGDKSAAKAPKLDSDYKPTGKTVARVHQSEIDLAYDKAASAQAEPAPNLPADMAPTDDMAAATVAPAPYVVPETTISEEAIARAAAEADAIAAAAPLPVMELTEDLMLEEDFLAEIEPEALDATPAVELAAQEPPARVAPPVALVNQGTKPELDLGVMELTAEFELDERLLAAIEPIDMQLAQPFSPADAGPAEAEPAPALAVADTGPEPAAPAVAASTPSPVEEAPVEIVLRSTDSSPLAEQFAEAVTTNPEPIASEQSFGKFDLATVNAEPSEEASALSQVIELQKPVQAGGMALGNVDLRISGSSTIEVRLNSILSLLQDQMEPRLYAQLSAADNANTYVSFSDLRAAGIRINFDPVRDMLTMSADAS